MRSCVSAGTVTASVGAGTGFRSVHVVGCRVVRHHLAPMASDCRTARRRPDRDSLLCGPDVAGPARLAASYVACAGSHPVSPVATCHQAPSGLVRATMASQWAQVPRSVTAQG